MARLNIETPYELYRIEKFPIRIGKAVDNDIVLRSAGIADYHLIIEEKGDGLHIRKLSDARINGKKINSSQYIEQNSIVTLGSRWIKLWFNKNLAMPNPADALFWRIICHPISACIWFFLCLLRLTWQDYLASAQEYSLNLLLLSVHTGLTFFLLALMHSLIVPLAKRYLFFPLLGLISFLSFIYDLSYSLTQQLIFQSNLYALNYLHFLLNLILSYVLVRLFCRDFIPLTGRALNHYSLIIALPILFLISYLFLNENNFYDRRANSQANYQSLLLPQKSQLKKAKSIAQFFD